MGIGIYYRVTPSGAGTISASGLGVLNDSTSSSSWVGASNYPTTGTASFVASANSGYTFVRFRTYINSNNQNSSGLTLGSNNYSTSTSCTVSAKYVNDGEAFGVEAIFESSDSSGGGSSDVYYYRAYDLTTKSYLTGTTLTISDRISAPDVDSSYIYKGYVCHTSYEQCISYNANGTKYDGTGVTCTIHNSTYPYIVFFYEQNAPSITSWQAPISLATYTVSAQTATTKSDTRTFAKNTSGYIRVNVQNPGTITFKTTSGAKTPDYYSVLAMSTGTSSPLVANSGTSRTSAVVKDTSAGYLTYNDDYDTSNSYDTSITYDLEVGKYYYWYINAAFEATGTYSVPYTLTYTPKTAEKIYVIYDSNGGSENNIEANGTVGDSFITPNQRTRSGYIFKGWATTNENKKYQIKPGDSFIPTNNITLYAVWWPEFSWNKKNADEANTFAGYINNIFDTNITNVKNNIYKIDWYNIIISQLNGSTITKDTIITKNKMEDLITKYKNY